MAQTFVIVGASLAGGTAAATLRHDGFDGDVILIGAEPHPPYERPPLSKQYLRGEVPFEHALVRPAGFYEANAIDTRFGDAATHIDPAERKVELASGRSVRYDKLLIATGVRNRRPPIPGLDLQNVFDLRSVDDADALRGEIVSGRKAAVIGMGFIGCEVAASLRQQGVEVVCIDPSPTPLFRVLGEQLGRVMSAIHGAHGVEMIFEDVVTRFEGDRRVVRAITRSGRLVDCDFAVVAVGVEPVVDFLAASGVEIDNGILVDEYCRTNVEDIYAAGDVANHYHPLFQKRMRVEHWQNAMQQGAAAARNMLGARTPYDPVHWFWSDQYDVNLQYAGFHREWDQVVVRGNLDARTFIAFYVNQQRIDAVVALNRGKDVRRAMPLIQARMAVDVRRLGDEAVDLRSMWPRGLSKERLHLTAWLKEAGPSTELRKWFNHDPKKWSQFRTRYFRELDSRPESWQPILAAARRGTVTLVYSSHDEDHNNAVALKEYLKPLKGPLSFRQRVPRLASPRLPSSAPPRRPSP